MLAPVNATMPSNVGGGALVAVTTDYPFGDMVTVVVQAKAAVELRIRIPGWAYNATLAIDGSGTTAVPADSVGSYHTIDCKLGRTLIELDLHPDIRVELGWGLTGMQTAAVVRGALLYALPLPLVKKLLHPPWACFETGCAEDMAFTSGASWNYALMLPEASANSTRSVSRTNEDAHDFTQVARSGGRVVVNPPSLTFMQVGHPDKTPFADASPPVRITARVRLLPGWHHDPKFPQSPAHPPASPVSCEGGDAACSEETTVELVPYGSTRLRVAAFPWIAEPAEEERVV